MVVLRARRAASRCALCHDALVAPGRVCEGCGAALHPECWGELADRCPSLGCAAAQASAPRAGEQEALPLFSRWELLGLALVALAPSAALALLGSLQLERWACARTSISIF